MVYLRFRWHFTDGKRPGRPQNAMCHKLMTHQFRTKLIQLVVAGKNWQNPRKIELNRNLLRFLYGV